MTNETNLEFKTGNVAEESNEITPVEASGLAYEEAQFEAQEQTFGATQVVAPEQTFGAAQVVATAQTNEVAQAEASVQTNVTANVVTPVQTNVAAEVEAPVQANVAANFETPKQTVEATHVEAPVQTNVAANFETPKQTVEATHVEAPVQTNVATNVEVPKQTVQVESPVQTNDNISMEDVIAKMDSEKCVDFDASWSELTASFEQNKIFETEVVDFTKSGLLVNVNRIRGFIPASQIDLDFIEDLSDFVGKTIKIRIVEMNKDKKSIILSRRNVLQEEKSKMVTAVLGKLEEGSTVEGAVTGLTKFGAFIQVGEVEGLVHVSEISHMHIKNPEDALTLGEKVNAKIVSVNPEEGRLSLSIKATQKSPWEVYADQLKLDAVLQGTVKRTPDFGAFVEVFPGIEGLVHVSEISHAHVRAPKDVLNVGDEVSVKITEIDESEQRLRLSIKATQVAPWEKYADQLKLGAIFEGKIMRVAEFGAFVEILPGIEGLLHISQVSHEHIVNIYTALKEGEVVKVKVTELDIDAKKVSVSIKALYEQEVSFE